MLGFCAARGAFTIEFGGLAFSHQAPRPLALGTLSMLLNVFLLSLFCSFFSGTPHSAWHIGSAQKVFIAEVESD